MAYETKTAWRRSCDYVLFRELVFSDLLQRFLPIISASTAVDSWAGAKEMTPTEEWVVAQSSSVAGCHSLCGVSRTRLHPFLSRENGIAKPGGHATGLQSLLV